MKTIGRSLHLYKIQEPTQPTTIQEVTMADSAAPALKQLGDFRIIREVGRGGMGIVYEAEQVSLGRHVALKVLPNKALFNARHKRRFEREAKSAAKLHHTNIVPVFGVGEQDGLPYYVMQFIQGLGMNEGLAEWVRRQSQSGPTSRGDPSREAAADLARTLRNGELRLCSPTVAERADDEATEYPSDADRHVTSNASVVLPGQSVSKA